MKIIIVSDLHQQRKCLDHFVRVLDTEKPEGVLCPGDVTDRGTNHLEYAKKFVEVCKTRSVPLRVVHGNNDDLNVRAYFKEQGILWHFQCEKIWDTQFCGVGWLDEEGPSLGFAEASSKAIPERFDVAGSILVTHAPPISASRRTAQVDPKSKPALHISGHMHSWEGEQERNGIRWVRIPTFMRGRYAVLTLPDQKVIFRSI
jgi:Icc-related predicted phosphoesterase